MKNSYWYIVSCLWQGQPCSTNAKYSHVTRHVNSEEASIAFALQTNEIIRVSVLSFETSNFYHILTQWDAYWDEKHDIIVILFFTKLLNHLSDLKWSFHNTFYCRDDILRILAPHYSSVRYILRLEDAKSSLILTCWARKWLILMLLDRKRTFQTWTP